MFFMAGMDELDGQAYGVAQAWNSTFSLYGVDSANFSAFSEGYAYKLNDFKFDIAGYCSYKSVANYC